MQYNDVCDYFNTDGYAHDQALAVSDKLSNINKTYSRKYLHRLPIIACVTSLQHA